MAAGIKLKVRVHAGARIAKTEQRGAELHLWVSARAVDGKANASVIETLAKLHRLPKSAVRLISGLTSKTKVFELDDR